MGDYHTTYKEPEGTTTEWDDMQVPNLASSCMLSWWTCE